MSFTMLGRVTVALWVVALLALAAPQPGGEAGKVALLAAKLFDQAHFSHHKLDDRISAKFLQKYLEALDYNRMLFLQSDLHEFETYRHELDDRTFAEDASPAFQIFARYEQRVEQAVNWAKEFLKQPFDFTGDDRILIDRSKAEWPADEQAARALWQQRVKYELLQEQLNKSKPEEAVKVVTRRYDRMLRNIREMDSEDVAELYVNALCHAYDPHSDYLGRSELKNFEIGMRLSLVGIGAVLKSEDGYTKIVSLVPGGPADLDKRLKVNDRIVAVAQDKEEAVEIVDLKLSKVVEMIRGTKGTKVHLTVIPADAPDSSVRKVITIVRDEVKLTEQEAKARVIEREPTGPARSKKIGVIELPSFYADTDKERNGDQTGVSTTRHVRMLLDKLKAQNVDGIVLDLRKNGGGLLDEAVSLAGLFIEEGPVVQVKDYKNRIQVLEDEDPAVAYSGPLVVLTSHVSASASEIFAAAMQDYGRGLVVGDSKTFGKGTVQTMVPLSAWVFSDGKAGALKLTTQKFYRVAGGSTQNRGVIPDIVLPSIYDAREIGESALDNALPYDEVSPAVFDRQTVLQQHLGELKKRSAARLSHDRDFANLKDDIARLSARIKDGHVSLNLAKRQQEKKADEDRAAARKKERLARKTPEPKLTEIALHPVPRPAAGGASDKPSAAASTPAAPAGADDEEEEKGPAVDAALNETLAILGDLIDLVSAAGQVAVSKSAATP